jgi:hypothetical protein
MRRALHILVLAGLASCDAPGAVPDPDAAGPSPVVLGTTSGDLTAFLPLVGEQTLVAGAQGGYHVWLRLRLARMGMRDVRVHRTARRSADARLILDTEGVLSVGEAGPDGVWELPGDKSIPTFMCPSPIGVAVQGQPLRLEVTVSDAQTGEALGTGTAEFTPRCPDGDQAAHCVDICSG